MAGPVCPRRPSRRPAAPPRPAEAADFVAASAGSALASSDVELAGCAAPATAGSAATGEPGSVDAAARCFAEQCSVAP